MVLVKTLVCGRSSGYGQLDEDSLFGNTRRMGHSDDLSMVMSPSSICRVCEYVVSGFHCPSVHSVQLCSTSRSLYAVWNECRSVSSSASEKDIDKIESCQQAQTTHRAATDLGRSAIRNAEIAGHVLGVSAASAVKAVVGLGTLYSSRNVECPLQRDDEDDKERTEVDADDKHDF